MFCAEIAIPRGTINADNTEMREYELVEQSIHLIPQFALPEGYLRFSLDREVSVGGSIADVVLMASAFEPDSQLRRLSVKEAVVLAQLRRHGTTRIDLLEKRCRLNRGALREGVFRRMVDEGLVERGNGGSVSIAKSGPPQAQVLAIEAKLRKWKDALRQAVDYKRYADYSYVLLPAQFAKQAIENRDQFEQSGVGLWVLENGQLKCLVGASRSADHCWRREFVVSRMAQLEQWSTCE